MSTSGDRLFFAGGPATPASWGASRGDPTVRGPRTAYSSPTGGEPAVLAPFDAPAKDWLPGHRGADLLLPDGGRVLVPAAGVVAFAGTVAGRPVVSIDHPDGARTSYEPVVTELSAGDTVVAGAVLGALTTDPRLASDPGVPGLHGPGVLHWGARVREGADGWRYIDPMTLLAAPVIRLLPL